MGAISWVCDERTVTITLGARGDYGRLPAGPLAEGTLVHVRCASQAGDPFEVTC